MPMILFTVFFLVSKQSSSASTMMQVVGMLGFSSCNYCWNSIKLRKTMRVVTSCPTPPGQYTPLNGGVYLE